MNERIKQLRKILGLTQQEFGYKIGVKRNTIAQYEIGRNEPIDSVFSLICKEFNVNETWLRTGLGDMFIKLDKEDILMEWAGNVLKDDSSSFRKRFVTMLMTLNEDEWSWLEKKAQLIIEDREKEDQ